MSLFHHKRTSSFVYDSTRMIPIIRTSICNGEQVAGFKDRNTGEFHEIMLIKDPKNMKQFLEEYHLKIEEIKKEY